MERIHHNLSVYSNMYEEAIMTNYILFDGECLSFVTRIATHYRNDWRVYNNCCDTGGIEHYKRGGLRPE